MWSKHRWTSGVTRRFNLIQERATKKQDDQFKNEMNFMANKPNYTLKDYRQKVSLYTLNYTPCPQHSPKTPLTSPISP